MKAAAVGIALVALAVASVGFTDPAYLDFSGDAPRYLMNGAFLHDALRDAPIVLRNPMAYAEQYYARYPALSLGHHPLIPSLMMVPLFALFGISVTAARVVPLVSFLAASLLVFALADRMFERRVAVAAAMLFVLSPFAARFSRTVMSEMPALAALMATVYCVDRYVRDHERRHLWLGIVFAFISVTAKLLTAFILPVLALHLVGRRGLGWLLKGRGVLALAGAAVALAAAIEILKTLTPYNMRWVSTVAETPFNVSDVGYAWSAMDLQLTWPVALLAGAGVLVGVARKEGRTALFIAWVLSFAAVVVFLTKRFEPERFTVYWIPALCMLAASTIGGWKSRFMQAATMIILAISLGFEAAAASRVDLEGAGGYEDAARYVVQHTNGPAGVLFSGDLDTGYFTFFVRKYDAGRHLIVLRSDKLLTTSLVRRVAFKELIHDPAEIDRALMGLGIRFVVLEDRPSSSRVQNWLRDRLRRPPFVERQRIPLQSRSRLLEHVDLAIFENTEATPADPDRPLTLDLPIVGRTINLPLGDVLAGPGRRE